MTEVAGTTANVASAWIDGLIASNRGNRHAFVYAGKRYSYQDVAALMNRAGNLIKGLGLGTGAPILLLLPGSPALVASLLGAIKAGAVAIVGAPRDDLEGLTRCVAASKPEAVVIHENCLATAEAALAGIHRDMIVVVGANVMPGYKSFVDEIRSLSSWLVAHPVAEDAPALSCWDGSSLRTLSHAELAAEIDASSRGEPFLWGEAQSIAAMVRAFAAGEEAELPASS